MKEQELKELLTGQSFETGNERLHTLNTVRGYAQAYAQATNGIAVISDFQSKACYIYSGAFGRILGLSESFIDADSAFEDNIFNNIPDEELLQRHILELRFFHFLKSVPAAEKTDYAAGCLIHFQRAGQAPLPVYHSTRYIKLDSNGNAWLGLCTYIPFRNGQGTVNESIINTSTGEAVCLMQCDSRLLSQRQLEIVSLLAKGYGSKQIADKLCISVHTVSRHRQDILSLLNVTNTAAAVEIALRMNLI